MATRKDLILDEARNLSCADGDLVASESDAQHVDLLLVSTKGMFKESPTVGVGMINFLKKQDSAIREMRRDIMVQFNTDGYKLTEMNQDSTGEYIIEYKPTYQ